MASDFAATARPTRWLLALAGVVGAVGVATAAGASHGDPRLLGSVSAICLAHAPAFLALSLFGLRSRWLMAAAVLLALGTVLFSADLIWRAFRESALLPMLAPLSGGALILGWVVLVVAAAMWRDR